MRQLLFLTCLALTACQPSVEAIQTAIAQTESARPTATFTLLPSPTPSPVDTPTPSLTPTITLTPTPSETPTITPTPTVTLPPGEALACIPQDSPREVATVVSIVDGDTIKVVIGQKLYSLRYIGIDSPESGARLASEASQANRALVMGETVTLVRDVSETDRYGRLLRYVVIGNTFVNLELVSQGLASAYDYPPDTACSSTFMSAQAAAVAAGLGLWALPAPTATRPFATVRAGNCSPSYPDVCIPPPPPDLDCKDIRYRRFRVLPPDPHHFDADHDGIGCES